MKFDKEFRGKLKDFGIGLGILLLSVLIITISWTIISTNVNYSWRFLLWLLDRLAISRGS